MQELVFTNANGESITINDYGEFRFRNLNLTRVIANNLNEASFDQDGTEYLGTTLLQPRDIIFGLLLRGVGFKDLYSKRRDILRIFNPKLGEGTLKYTNDFTSYTLKVVVDATPAFLPGKNFVGYHTMACNISLTAMDPFFFDNDETVRIMEDFLDRFRFPFHFKTKFATRGSTIVINNDGDVETPVEVTFFGAVEDPKITNDTTGEFIQVIGTVGTGQKLVINTEDGNKSVVLVTETNEQINQYSKITLDSTFWKLQQGENQISFEVTSGDNPIVEIRYSQKWVGV